MKSLLTATFFLLMFGGCSHNNAFSKFNMNLEQELATASLQSSKIKTDDEIYGVFSAIYLNEVYPEAYNQNEYFYIYVYLKDKKEIYDPNVTKDIELSIKLNGRLPIKIKQLPSRNQFTHLTTTSSEWNRYYIVAFEEDGKELSLVLESGQSSSAELTYQKDEQ